MYDKSDYFLFGLLTTCAVAFVAFLAYQSGSSDATTEFREKAIIADVAEWQVNDDGVKSFSFKK